jgi:hypothetical protein
MDRNTARPLETDTLGGLMRHTCAWLVIGWTLALVPPLDAQTAPTIVISGLKGPGKLLALETGALLVAESGTGVHDGRVTAFDTDGHRLTLIDGLPSGRSFPNNDPSSVSGLALRNHTLYLSIGAGDSGLAGPVPGSEVPNPNTSSPIFSSVLALEFDRNLSGVSAPFQLTPAHHQALARGERVALRNERGEGATLRLVVDIPDHQPEPRPDSPQNVRTSNPFGLEPDGSCALWLVDASRNVIWKVDICTNTVSTLASFPPTVNPTPVGPPRLDAVPTSARAWNGDLLVSCLSGAPFLPGLAQVRLLKPSTGEHAPFFVGLRMAVDVLPVGGETDGFFVIEFSRDPQAGLPGRVLWYDSPSADPVTFADGLVTPVNMAIDPRTGDLLVSQLALGRVVSIATRR